MPDTKKMALAVVLLGLAGGSWWLSQGPTQPPVSFDGETRHDPDYIVEAFTANVMNEQGRRKYTLTAKRLVHYPDDDTAELELPHLIQYGKEGATVHTRADRGMLLNQTNQLEMSGRVRITRERDARRAGGEIKTENIRILLDK